MSRLKLINIQYVSHIFILYHDLFGTWRSVKQETLQGLKREQNIHLTEKWPDIQGYFFSNL